VARLVNVTFASGIADPEESVTVPDREPNVDWAATGVPVIMAARQKQMARANATKERPDDVFIKLFPPPKKHLPR